ncbi:hypothetical protein [Bradyrhizobium sp. ERR14]|uniref:hypothetical protein n=1 Tax=Bradyrhizobium sp. ERR14 TaxID=2663837 RepID=UPI0016207EA8|nr:hypothetical protein [Bradyrhizobium sp. ERR14]MBB4396839.1 hypothetical protein [Bradyrhizobium sp. ERR14]
MRVTVSRKADALVTSLYQSRAIALDISERSSRALLGVKSERFKASVFDRVFNPLRSRLVDCASDIDRRKRLFPHDFLLDQHKLLRHARDVWGDKLAYVGELDKFRQ